VVAPVFYTTGNPRTYSRGRDEIDFNAGTVIQKKETIAQAGQRLIEEICKIAQGKMTKMETWAYQDLVEVFLTGPKL